MVVVLQKPTLPCGGDEGMDLVIQIDRKKIVRV